MHKVYSEISSHLRQHGYPQENKQQQMLMKMQGKGNPHVLLVGVKISPATIENSMEVHQKAKSTPTL
jgi:UDP-N-acetyl-D-mannosaminuronic acid transferase (WecB/TagA/CpsF family)